MVEDRGAFVDLLDTVVDGYEVGATQRQAAVLVRQEVRGELLPICGQNADLLSLPWVVSPSRKWRAESAEREHGEGDDGFL